MKFIIILNKEKYRKNKVVLNAMQRPTQGLSSHLQDSSLTVNSQIHRQGGGGRGRITQLTQVKQYLTRFTKN